MSERARDAVDSELIATEGFANDSVWSATPPTRYQAALKVIERLLEQIETWNAAHEQDEKWEQQRLRERLEDRMDRWLSRVLAGAISTGLKVAPKELKECIELTREMSIIGVEAVNEIVAKRLG